MGPDGHVLGLGVGVCEGEKAVPQVHHGIFALHILYHCLAQQPLGGSVGLDEEVVPVQGLIEGGVDAVAVLVHLLPEPAQVLGGIVEGGQAMGEGGGRAVFGQSGLLFRRAGGQSGDGGLFRLEEAALPGEEPGGQEEDGAQKGSEEEDGGTGIAALLHREGLLSGKMQKNQRNIRSGSR